MIAFSTIDRDALIRTVWGEARGEPEEGKVAVAWVVINRAMYRPPAWWGHTISDVCYRPWQFSCHNAGDPNAEKCRDLCESDDAYQEIATIVTSVLNGHTPDPTGGATFYKATGTKASWDKAAAQHTPVVIGRHSFFKMGPHE